MSSQIVEEQYVENGGGPLSSIVARVTMGGAIGVPTMRPERLCIDRHSDKPTKTIVSFGCWAVTDSAIPPPNRRFSLTNVSMNHGR